MTFTDPIGDMFSRIRNGQMRSLNSVEIPSSNFRKNILEILKTDKSYKIVKQTYKEEKKYSPNPLITSTLQRVAQAELGFKVKKTMDIAQKLYENGKIT